MYLTDVQTLPHLQQVNRSDGDSGAVEQSQHHILTLTHLIPWHLATILLSGICSNSAY